MAKKDQGFKTSIGGQALIEGIYMRGPKKQATVVRSPEGLVEKIEETKLPKDRCKLWGVPFIRGSATFVSSMVSGVKSLNYSAEVAMGGIEEEETGFEKWLNGKLGKEKADKFFVGAAVVLGIVLAVAIFMLLPTLLTGILNKVIENRWIKNLIEGFIRIAIFIGYISLMRLTKDIKRLFMYHGAEHKTIFCYEHGLELTVENVRIQKKEHPRCGTSFLFIVMIISILVFSVISWKSVWMRMGLRILMLPIVVGISYEISRWTGRHDNILSTILAAPGKAMQKLTTAEPDDSMMEVAITAMKHVIPEEKGTDRW
ncbi:MAG: DUF1385 domain-containing protein [Oscillospiraceae bacterium]|nr:DUF1385 domain-containing protein [Oscillospiraceae bacterium]